MQIDRAVLMALSIVAGGAVACASTPPESKPAQTDASAQKPPGQAAATSQDLATLARQTLADHLGRPVSGVELVSLDAIDWPDSSLGCPRPDRSYLQVITPGHVAVLREGGATYEVHMAGNRAFVCENLAAKIPKEQLPSRELALSLERLQTLARNDLARQLGVPVAEISATSSEPTVWIDTSLGCPAEGQTYKTIKARGYVLNLSYRGRTYTYHTDRYRVLPCPPFEKS